MAPPSSRRSPAMGRWSPEPRTLVTFTWVTCGTKGRVGDSSAGPGVGSESGRDRYNLIFANTITSLAIVERMMAQETALALLPLVVYVHESTFWLHAGDFQATTRMLRRARLIFAVSPSVRKTLEEVIQPAATISIVSGFLLERSPSNEGQASRPRCTPPFSLEQRSLEEWARWPRTRATDLFLAVALRIRQLLPQQQLRFIWIGHEHHPDIRRLLEHDIERAGLGDVAALPGGMEDPTSFFQSLSLFLLPSREDSWPLVMLEAAAAGVPIVCFQRSGGAEAFVANGGGTAVAYLDVEGMAQAAVRYLSDPELTARDAAIARQLARGVTPEGQVGQVASEVAQMLHSPLPNGASPRANTGLGG